MSQPDGDLSSVEEVGRAGDLIHLRVVLDYLWFTPIGYPPTLGNKVHVFVDGEESWRAVAAALKGSKRSIHVATWIYEPTMELLRPLPLSDPPAREPYTVQRVLEEQADAGVLVRLLLWDAPFVRLPHDARRMAIDSEDNLEVLTEANPTTRPLIDPDAWPISSRLVGSFPIGSFHQKTIVVDGSIGFCTGMNLRENDWDTGEHAIFDPRRCRFARPSSYRAEVRAKIRRADHPPRHDFTARVEGPAVKYLEENFRERWNRLIERGTERSARATPIGDIEPEPLEPGEPDAPSSLSSPPSPPSPPSPATLSQVQVIRTMPAPHNERGILDVHLRAIQAAKRLIYIEDQYFRSIHVSEAIADAARARPGLHVIVLTTRAHADAPLAGSWARECFDRILRQRPDFELYTLRVGTALRDGVTVLAEVDTHAKLMIVDDRFMTVGSCNINDRGFEFEGELNLAIVDPPLARGLRLDLWRSHLGGDPRIEGDIDADVAVWKEHAARNRSYQVGSEPPQSRVFPFVPRAKRVILFGHDVF
jgi:phosphatidylserine/phosphatidylglycerophosphate/cardiolipin synthase-like enzyme